MPQSAGEGFSTPASQNRASTPNTRKPRVPGTPGLQGTPCLRSTVIQNFRIGATLKGGGFFISAHWRKV